MSQYNFLVMVLMVNDFRALSLSTVFVALASDWEILQVLVSVFVIFCLFLSACLFHVMLKLHWNVSLDCVPISFGLFEVCCELANPMQIALARCFSRCDGGSHHQTS